ncbi:MAG: flagellar filament capping protein FliD [Gallionella sp.]|nr:flagellar filament capping protein FliD [Gallionella sp.]
MATSAVSGNGLDVNGIVSQLMTVERQPINKLLTQEAVSQSKLSAFGTVMSAMSTFQTAVQGLSNASSFQSVKATSSDTTTVTATSTSTAAAGVYSLDVLSLAQTQKLVATGQASSTAAIGAGAATTVTFDFGSITGGTFSTVTGQYTGAAFASNGSGIKSIVIDSTNNSLQGISAAINAANMGVTAAIVNDGSGTPYRLTLSSNNSGISNSMKISVTGDAAINTLLGNDPAAVQNMSETATAQNANFKVNGLAISKATNTVSDVIQGTTLTLSKITTAPVVVTMAQDTAALSTAVTSFVSTYNNLASALKTISAYDPVTKKGAPLQGNSTVRMLQTQLRSMLNQPITGTSGGLTSLAQIGITSQKDGSIALDSAKLNTAMTTNFKDIAGLFAATGSATDSLVSFNAATASAKPGNYALSITQMSSQGSVTGNAVANTTITAGTNDTLNLNVNGVYASVVLAAGVYTAQSLATEVQSKLNGASALTTAGVSVAVSQTAGTLSITSANYGSSSSVTVAGGNGAPGLLGAAPVQTAGVDVAGTIGGVAATGTGKKLTDANGLSFDINGGALGARGTLNFSQGYAYKMSQWITPLLATGGALPSATSSINKTMTDSSNRRATLETRMIAIEARYRQMYTALDKMLSSMNTTSTYLSQQLSSMA